MVADPTRVSPEQRQAILSRCLELAIEGETYEFTTMDPEFAAQAHQERDGAAEAEFHAQVAESHDHATIFRKAASNFGLLTPIEQHHAERYGIALQALQGGGQLGDAGEAVGGKWICRICLMIYDPAQGDPDSGIAPGTPLGAIPADWACPIRGTSKADFISYKEPKLVSVCFATGWTGGRVGLSVGIRTCLQAHERVSLPSSGSRLRSPRCQHLAQVGLGWRALARRPATGA